MSAGQVTAPVRPFNLARARRMWREPLYRSGHALVVSYALTSGIGVAFWVAAARLYPVTDLGRNAAAVSAMIFLATAAQLNLKSALVRFVPVAGARVSHLVAGAYLLGGLLTGLVAAVFVAGLDLWAPDLAFLTANPLVSAWFVASAACWSIFIMQESALTGAGRAVIVPIGNLVFSVAKVLLLIAFAGMFPAYGILGSWTATMVVVAAATNVYLFLRVLPRFARLSAEKQRVPARQLTHFASWDYVGSLLNYAAIWLMPVIVLGVVGAEEAAVFTLVWQAAHALYLVPSAMGQSLVAHTASDPPRLGHHGRAILTHTLGLLLPAVAVLVVAAPYLLSIVGDTYRDSGTTLLRLLALSALPAAVTALAVSEARVRSRMRVVVAVLAGVSGTVLGLSLLLLPVLGIEGVGLAWLIGQTLVAGVIGAGRLRRAPWAYRYARLTRRVLRGLPEFAADRTPGAPRALRVLPSQSDTAVSAVGTDHERPVAFVKIATTGDGAGMLSRQVDVLATLHGHDQLGEWRELLPRIVAGGTVEGHHYLVEEGIAALDGRSLLEDSQLRDTLVACGAQAIGRLHRGTAAPLLVDDGMLAEWIDGPAQLVRRALPPPASRPGLHTGLHRLTSKVRGDLAGRRLAGCWVHGDYCPDNILVTPDGGSVVGIVDWGQAQCRRLGALDIVTLLLTADATSSRREFGEVVRARLAGSVWDETERHMLAAATGKRAADSPSDRTLLMLGWLNHVAGNLGKSRLYARNRVWMSRNVAAVLRGVADE